MPAGIVGALMSVVGGRLYDDKGGRFPIITGASLMAAELIAFVCLSQQMSDLVISLVYIIYMTGMGMSIGVIMTNALASLKPEFSAQGNAFLNTIQQFAGAIGTSLTSAIVGLSQAQYGSKGPAADSNRHPARLYFPGRNRSLPLAHVLQERENRRWI
ncbi:hypothetical protein LOB54_05560 [Lactobacillus delbrueckii subsp. bulgaricus]|nr:MFS transporter [Lactobacillus delbrueckii]MCD5477737.1 hypothetical protein [Lactobacillus delbrueckii subsp. bulgaricus]